MSRLQQDFSTFAADFDRDGVVIARQVLSEAEMQLVEQLFVMKQANPGPASEQIYPNVFYSVGNSIEHPIVQTLMRDSALGDLAQGIFGGSEVWYENEQLWLKEGGVGRRTAWHQDSAYDCFAGSKTVVLWVPLETLPAENVLEVIRGTHKGPVYNGTRFDPNDDTAPTYDDPALLRLPDIEAERDKWDIYSTPMQRGDVLAFHHSALHGGAPVFAGQRRRSISFRLFGDDALYKPRGRRVATETGSLEYREKTLAPGFENLASGEPIHHSPEFRKVRPWAATSMSRTG